MDKNGEKEEVKEEDKQEGESKQEGEVTKMEQEQTVASEKEPDWESIQAEIEVFYSVWNSIILDLYNIGVSSEQIIGFSNTLDNLLICVQQKDKIMSAVNLANLYGFLPKYVNLTNIDTTKKDTIQTKSYVLNAYAYLQNEEFNKVQVEISNAEGLFKDVVTANATSEEGKKYNINKTYILIGELKNSISTKNTEIFYIKYKNLLEELNTLL